MLVPATPERLALLIGPASREHSAWSACADSCRRWWRWTHRHPACQSQRRLRDHHSLQKLSILPQGACCRLIWTTHLYSNCSAEALSTGCQQGLGADEILDYHASDFGQALQAHKVDLVLDTVGGVACLTCLCFTGCSTPPCTPDAQQHACRRLQQQESACAAPLRALRSCPQPWLEAAWLLQQPGHRS